ncbi:MAG: hypothetical protein K6E64_01915 [Lachnospiraceae bacterium]|nr:hypothetical protein [Lachnospiraceae bacterium]
MSKRRRRRAEAKRPKSQLSVTTAAVGGVILLIYIALLAMTIGGSSQSAKWMAGIGVISMLASAVAFGKSIAPFRDQGYDTLTRWIGMLFPLAAFIVWMWTYFAGVIWG